LKIDAISAASDVCAERISITKPSEAASVGGLFHYNPLPLSSACSFAQSKDRYWPVSDLTSLVRKTQWPGLKFVTHICTMLHCKMFLRGLANAKASSAGLLKVSQADES
jgi:hypothetical protein